MRLYAARALGLVIIATMLIGTSSSSVGLRRESLASSDAISGPPSLLAMITRYGGTRALPPVILRVHRSTVNQIRVAFADLNEGSVEESFFAVQRSADGEHWEFVPVCHETPRPPCSKVVPRNPGTGRITVWDEDPPKHGTVHYRVVQTNLFGKRHSDFYVLTSAEDTIDSTWRQLSIMCRLPSADDLGFDLESFTREDVMEMMWRTKDHWSGISNGHFDVSGILEAEAPGDATGWIAAGDLTECARIARQMGYDDRLYDNTAYIHSNPGIVDCTVNFPAVAFRHYAIGKSEGWSEERLEHAFQPTVALFVHEFGHNLLLNPVRVTECGSASTNDLLPQFWPSDAECVHNRRTDTSPIDVMGSGYGYHNSGGLHAIGLLTDADRESAGSLHDGIASWRGRTAREARARTRPRHHDDSRPTVLTVTESGTHRIEPMMGPDGPSAGIKALRVWRSGGTILYLEYRRSYGIDAQIDAARINLEGALIHIRDGYPLARYTTLIDPIGPTDVRDTVLPIGVPWTDDLSGSGGATYEVLDHDEDGLTIHVEFHEAEVH